VQRQIDHADPNWRICALAARKFSHASFLEQLFGQALAGLPVAREQSATRAPAPVLHDREGNYEIRTLVPARLRTSTGSCR
jgi:hypothetical protein